MNEDVFLLYEDDVHYSLLVDKNEGIHEDTVIENEGTPTEGVTENNMYDWENPDNGEFIDNLYASLFPGENIGLPLTEHKAPSFEYTPPLAPDNSEQATGANTHHGLETKNIPSYEEEFTEDLN